MNEQDQKRCDEEQEKICALKMQTILDSIAALKSDAKADELVLDNRTKEIFFKIDQIWDILSGGGRAGTGLNPRLMVVEVKTEKTEKSVDRLDGKLDKYIEERAAFERKLVWGVLGSLGTATLSMIGMVGSQVLQWMLKNHG